MSDTESDLRAALFAAPAGDSYNGPAEDALNDYDRKFLRKGVRLEVPLLNRFLLRECGDILSGLGQQLASISRRNDLTDRQVLFDAKVAVSMAQIKILERRKGRKEIL